MEDRAVVDYLAVIITPDCISYPARANLRHVASDETIQIIECFGPGNAVFRHRRQIEDGGGIANRKILRVSAIQ